ncbi:hypothetical protein PHISP_04254 [Aspergillus sp. HF37]|nr:hypothetical protein PHISP_04254 [Aspergillus sp. HF37]
MATMLSETNDSDDDTRSDRLEAQNPNYGPDVSEPPPFAQGGSSPGSDGTEDARMRTSSKHPKPAINFGDMVLLEHLAPNERQVARNALLGDEVGTLKRKQQEPKPDSQKDLSAQAEIALSIMKNEPQKDWSKNPSPSPDEPATKHEPKSSQKGRRLSVDKDPLEKFPLRPSERILPALQRSPPSASGASPSNTQNLPSLQSALGELPGVPQKDPSGRVSGASPYPYPLFHGTSPSVPRNDLVREPQVVGQFLPPQIPPSPYSHLSPVSSKDKSNVSSPVSQQSFWRPPLKSDMPYVPSNYEASPQTMKSPAASYPTPTDQPADERPTFNPHAQSNGSVSTGLYKCRHPGCTAAPFQTQYLLNSHANVHSQDRPHFCPVAGCPRAVNGKGFKRKNEMIRHGLVHNSPGYVCPFCPDQQHKYPRPDNLQR